MRYKKTIISLLLMTVLVISCVLYAHFIEPQRMVIEKRTLTSEKIPEAFKDFNIAFISDLYIHDSTSLKQFEKAVNKINQANADVVILGGDVFHGVIYELETVKQLLTSIQVPYGKFAILGEADTPFTIEVEQLLFHGGFQVLHNEALPLYKDQATITLIGLDSVIPLDPLLKESMHTTYNIAFIHQPDAFVSLQHEMIDTQVSGHSFGGVVALPFFIKNTTEGALHYVSGVYIENNRTLLISNGIGMADYTYRFLAPPTILILNLQPRMAADPTALSH